MNTIKKLKENFVGAVLNAAGVEGEYQNKKSMIQGWLTKRATKSAKNWDLRYFMLFDNALVYFADSDSNYPRGEMKFNEDFFVADSLLVPYGFQVSDLTTTYYLQADTMAEKLFWMHAIAKVIRNLAPISNVDNDTNIITPQSIKLEQAVNDYAAHRAVSSRFVKPTNFASVNSDSSSTSIVSSTSSTTTTIGGSNNNSNNTLEISKPTLPLPPHPPPRQEKNVNSNLSPTSTSTSESAPLPPRPAPRNTLPLKKQNNSIPSSSINNNNNNNNNTTDNDSIQSSIITTDHSSLSTVDENCTYEENNQVFNDLSISVSLPTQSVDIQPVQGSQRLSQAISPISCLTPQYSSLTIANNSSTSSFQSFPTNDPLEFANVSIAPHRISVQKIQLSSQLVNPVATEFVSTPSMRIPDLETLRKNSLLDLSEESASTDNLINKTSNPPPLPPRPNISTTTTTTPTSTTISVAPNSQSPPPPPPRNLNTSNNSQTITKQESNESNESNETQTESSVKAKASIWQSKVQDHQVKQSSNPFSESENRVGTNKPKKTSDEYGKPPPGSLTAERAAQANEWVNQEINKLLNVIKDIGTTREDGTISILFGPLFYAYQDISDTLVGIMMRAKKRGYIHYLGDMLFQGYHDDVEILVLKFI